jgi:hypothetical protein
LQVNIKLKKTTETGGPKYGSTPSEDDHSQQQTTHFKQDGNGYNVGLDHFLFLLRSPDFDKFLYNAQNILFKSEEEFLARRQRELAVLFEPHSQEVESEAAPGFKRPFEKERAAGNGDDHRKKLKTAAAPTTLSQEFLSEGEGEETQALI